MVLKSHLGCHKTIYSVESSLNWTVKYAPKNRKEIIGNKTIFDSLFNWIVKYSSQKERIALLAGPPGIGKTSGTFAIAKELKYELIEFNASDQRNEAGKV